MGVCASSATTGPGGTNTFTQAQAQLRLSPSPAASPVRIIHVDGRLQEFRQPIRAQHILSQNPGRLLCSLESMNLDSYVEQVQENEELQLGQIYFLLPHSKSQTCFSLSDLCTLAIRASTAMRKHDPTVGNTQSARLRSSSASGVRSK